MAQILVVDDDDHIRELVAHYLRGAGFAVIAAEDGEPALGLLESTKVDLAILDVMMPGTDGFELCPLLRRSYDMPILMLTARGATSDKVKGFTLGTDDYLVKPFEPPELLARVRALLRRYQISSSQRVTAGALTLDSVSREIIAATERLTIPLKEFELLF
ncbi:MAG TPA: response regulator transcription factor, partial [Spirochaetia bacterium]|nr:response regulator transcription factor [Spirochaetia bacterium]